MAPIQQRLLIALLLSPLGVLQLPCAAQSPAPRRLNEFRDYLANTFGKPGQRHSDTRQYPALNADGTGEVADSAWYQNRHARRRMPIPELVRGAGDRNPPSTLGPWTVVAAKREGVTPGFEIRDRNGRRYLLKFDPPAHPELASGAEVVASKFFHALGYHVPENYIVTFDRSRLVAGKEIGDETINSALGLLRKDANGKYRALASLYLEGEPLGPFLFHGVRGDDPEDKIPHEHRRELRGLYVMSAWLNHTDSKAGNTLDVYVEDSGVRRVKHYLIDFGATLGSASIEAKSPRQGHEYLLDLKPALAQLITMGVYVPKWARVRHADLPAVGAFEADAFDPGTWKPNYPNPAFANRLPDDNRWAARKVMAFRDDEIRAIVETGKYSDPRAVDWISQTLVKRRDKIVRAFAGQEIAFNRIRLEGGRLAFEPVEGSSRMAAGLDVQWLLLNDGSKKPVPLGRPRSLEVPDACAATGTWCAARIAAPHTRGAVTVYVAKGDRQIEIAAVDREE